MSNNITKTIKDSDMKAIEELLDEIIVDEENGECNVSYYKESYLLRLKSHLLQSQIRLIESVILTIGSEEYLNNDDLTEWSEGYNHCIKDQISSLNETLEELKKSL